MRTNLAMLAVLAGLGVSIANGAIAESRNLSCITDISPNERRVLRDCGPIAPEPPPVYLIVMIQDEPPIPPLPMKNGESKDRGGRSGGADHDHDSPNGGGAGGAAN